MRWAGFALLLLVIAGVGVIAVLQERDDDHDEQPTVVRVRDEAWTLGEVNANGRRLTLFYDAGGCARKDGRAIVRESRTTVRIVLRQGYDVNAGSESETFCPLVLRGATAYARLARPIAGRRVEGSGRIESRRWGGLVRQRGDGLVAGVPRVVGLAAGDAVELLGKQRFRARLRGRVVRQRPIPGTVVRLSGVRGPLATVTLTLGR